MAVIKGNKKTIETKSAVVIPLYRTPKLLGKAHKITGRIRRGGS